MPDGRAVAQIPIEDRLLTQRVITDVGCWEWRNSPNDNGYGRISWRSRVYRVHRVSAALWLGLDLNDAEVKVCHHCDNPPCFNPDHLYLGTQRENVGDMHARGRDNNGSAPWVVCSKGHPLTGDNLKVGPTGRRRCRQCANEYQAQWRADHVEEARAKDRERWPRQKAARALGASGE